MGIPTDLDVKTKDYARVGGNASLTLTCSFCGMTEHEVACMVQGPTSSICDFCIENIVYTIRKTIPDFCTAEHKPEYDD
jgi:hypothetical protein